VLPPPSRALLAGHSQAVYKPAPKLPARLFRNFAPDGPLFVIASECGKHMKAKNLKRVDWQNPSLRKEVGVLRPCLAWPSLACLLADVPSSPSCQAVLPIACCIEYVSQDSIPAQSIYSLQSGFCWSLLSDCRPTSLQQVHCCTILCPSNWFGTVFVLDATLLMGKLPSSLSHLAWLASSVFCHLPPPQSPPAAFPLLLSYPPAPPPQTMDLLARIRQELVRGGHLRQPRVFVHPSTGPNQLKLRDMVKRLGGETAQAADAVGVTHVVFPFGPKGDPDDGKQYLRTLEVGRG
jgi:hypothetical protein